MGPLLNGVDLVADAHDLHMVEDDSVDGVMIVNTLQHVHHPHRVTSEAFRVMKPGGVLYVNVPFVFPFHEDPNDFHRFSYDGLKVLCVRDQIDAGIFYIVVSDEGFHTVAEGDGLGGSSSNIYRDLPYRTQLAA